MKAHRVLVIGRTGQLARELARTEWPQGWTMDFVDRTRIDLSKPDQAAETVAAISPTIVINAAAYTAVDKAEIEPDLAFAINGEAPAATAAACARLKIPFVTVSTDYVFDGTKVGAYVEEDPVSPLGVYGRSKEQGERLVRAAHDWHLILRTSWVFSAFGTNFVRTMLRLTETHDHLRIVADQRGRPTSAADLARATVDAAAKLAADPDCAGTYHVANAGAMSWHGFAVAIFAEVARRGGRVPKTIEPVTTAEYPTPARRPANSELCCDRFEQTFGVTLRPATDALRDVMDELMLHSGPAQQGGA
jgi:dTDP-4-dehydrorhamnose reductase